MPKIIIVDDDDDDIYFFKKACQQVSPPPNVETLNDGSELLEFIEQGKADNSVILLDLNMPNMGGFDVLRSLNASDNVNHLVIVTYSTSTNPSDVRQCYELGVKSYITKPDSNGELAKLVSTLCQYWFEYNHAPLST
ncbi:response regulator [Alteromonas sediminis]|uniref:Response regulator n=1 Tax=Alteromonas sediminis TaxID=2259342 RepID=A0A3N5Y8H2_9ALTE|nr:response regulator [Alteromonas sediminis]RPJ67359.1 response regulator [Alteromonas sediminis]